MQCAFISQRKKFSNVIVCAAEDVLSFVTCERGYSISRLMVYIKFKIVLSSLLHPVCESWLQHKIRFRSDIEVKNLL